MSDQTTPIDTSAEAVEGYAVCLAARGYDDEAALLRALAAERDSLDADSIAQQERIEELKAERDAALARAARMRERISNALLEIEDAGPKALKYAEQELRAARAEDGA
jgi:hypothetical protein